MRYVLDLKRAGKPVPWSDYNRYLVALKDLGHMTFDYSKLVRFADRLSAKEEKRFPEIYAQIRAFIVDGARKPRGFKIAGFEFAVERNGYLHKSDLMTGMPAAPEWITEQGLIISCGEYSFVIGADSNFYYYGDLEDACLSIKEIDQREDDDSDLIAGYRPINYELAGGYELKKSLSKLADATIGILHGEGVHWDLKVRAENLGGCLGIIEGKLFTRDCDLGNAMAFIRDELEISLWWIDLQSLPGLVGFWNKYLNQGF